LDRTNDLISPLVHELTYQALIYDILTIDIENHTYHRDDGEDQVTILFSEKDIIWRYLRHRHFSEAREYLKQILNQQQEERENIQLTKEYLQKFNKIRTLKDKLEVHVKLASDCVKEYTKKKTEKCSYS